MSKCPVCSTDVDSSFGLKNCIKCGSLVFVNVDGSVEVSSKSVDVVEQAYSSDESKSSDAPVVEPEPFFDVTKQIQNSGTRDAEVNPEERGDLPDALKNFWVDPQQSESASPDAGMGQNDGGLSRAEGVDAGVASVVGDQPKAPMSPLSDIREFANSDVSSGQEGGLIYDVVIRGLDSIKAKTDFKDALSDRRLMIDLDSTMRGIKNGALVIRGLSSVKASVIVQRLKEQALDLSWTQRRVSQAENG